MVLLVVTCVNVEIENSVSQAHLLYRDLFLFPFWYRNPYHSSLMKIGFVIEDGIRYRLFVIPQKLSDFSTIYSIV